MTVYVWTEAGFQLKGWENIRIFEIPQFRIISVPFQASKYNFDSKARCWSV